MIREYEKQGQKLYQVRESVRSQYDPTIRIERSRSGIKTKQDAKRISKQLLRTAQQEVSRLEHRGVLWKDLVGRWELSAREDRLHSRSISEGTIEEYRSVLTRFVGHWAEKPVKEIDKADAWSALDEVEREISVSRRKRLRTAIDSVFKWAILSGTVKGISYIPTDGYKSTRKEEEKLPEILNLTEIRTLLEYAFKINHGWYPVWAVALFTGMRSGELYALQWNQVDFDNNVIYVHRNWTNKDGFGPTKGRYWRTVPIDGSQVLGLLKELKTKRRHGEFVLPRYQSWKDGRQAQILRKFCEGAGIPSVKFHTLRACFATQLIRDGVAPAVVMKICGWKDLKTMQRYIRLAGIEVQGATKGLKLLSGKETMGRVVELFNRSQK
ncbi:MAG: site-specific integrase [Pseudobdellovibrionaceae bacterium]|nr:MAG: site-specific integrase [Pseudobdellovibrionaceae bacterium]